MEKLGFAKMVAAGNDFIVVDARAGNPKNRLPELARRLADRKRSVGADGLILMQRSRRAKVRMRIFNPDGSEAEMCGNGVRCLAKFAVERKAASGSFPIETLAGIVWANVRGNVIRARLSDPKGLSYPVRLDISGRRLETASIDTGVPHAVVLVRSIAGVDVAGLGRTIRRHRRFAPRGTNVDFVQVTGKHGIKIRTYERGVEDETLSCGTGSAASALVASHLKNLTSPVKVQTESGETLKIYFKKEGGRFFDVELEGPVRTSFEGSVHL